MTEATPSVFSQMDLSSQSAEFVLRWEMQRRQREKDPLRAVVMSLFGEQRRFVLSPAKLKTADCSRRAGKSHGGGGFLYTCGRLRPGSTQLYLGLTRESAEQIFWPKLKEMDEQFNLGLIFQEAKLRAVIPETGSTIRLRGADQDKLANRLRGDAYGSVLVDEAQSFGSGLKYLIDDVLEPACIDFGGQIALAGTPGPVPAGLFYEATHGDTYEHFKWTLRDNPFIHDAENVLRAIRKRRGWADDNPTYLREYCGIWAYDPDALVYKFSRKTNIGKRTPGKVYNYALGIDLGYNDAFTLSIVGWSDDEPKAFICHSEAHRKTLPDFWAERIKDIQKRYDPVISVVDAGALGKPIVEQMIRRYGLPLKAAEKSEKMAHIAMMNSDFQSGILFVEPELTDLMDQYQILKKDENGKEDQALSNDLVDSALYGWRSSRHYWSAPPAIKPAVGSSEWMDAQETAMLDSALAANTQKSDNFFDF